MRIRKRTIVMVMVLTLVMIATGVCAEATNKEDKARYYLDIYKEAHATRWQNPEIREKLVDRIFEVEDKEVRDSLLAELERDDEEVGKRHLEERLNYYIQGLKENTNLDNNSHGIAEVHKILDEIGDAEKKVRVLEELKGIIDEKEVVIKPQETQEKAYTEEILGIDVKGFLIGMMVVLITVIVSLFIGKYMNDNR